MTSGLTRDRLLALAGLAGLFLVGIVCLVLLLGAGGGDEEGGGEVAAGTATATPTPTPTATATPKPTPPPLTPEQREQRSAAADQVRTQGFEPVSLRAYKPDRTLRVILGERDETAAAAAGGAPGRRAFFFVGDAYIGTDVSDASTTLAVARQSERTVTLRYGLTTGESESVRYAWDGTNLTPQSAIPPVDQRQGP